MGRAAERERFLALYERGKAAANEAAQAARPTGMVVGTPRNMMASLTGGDDGGFREDRPVYVVPDGPCGMGWVVLYAERGGESRRFVNFLRQRGLAKHSEYEGGYLIFPRVEPFTQSYVRNSAAAQAFAEVLRGEVEGLRAFSQTRLD
jgi:hypothetical protein